jgi:RNA polymerase sigma-70 factor, ECF subfamily
VEARGLKPADPASLDSDVRALWDRADHGGAATLTLTHLGGEVYSFLASVLRNETMAEDAFSVFIEGLWRGLPNFSWNSSLRTWVYAIARNASRMELRGEVRRRRRMVPTESAGFENLAAEVRTATASYLRTEKRSRLTALRESLTPEERAILILRVDRGLAWSDLARIVADDETVTWDEPTLVREAAKLRKRFQIIKQRLYTMAKKQGLRP